MCQRNMTRPVLWYITVKKQLYFDNYINHAVKTTIVRMCMAVDGQLHICPFGTNTIPNKSPNGKVRRKKN